MNEYLKRVFQQTNQPLGLFQSAFPDYTARLTESSPDTGGAPAYVRYNTPNTVYIDPSVVNSYPFVASHEFEHQLEAKAQKRYGTDQVVENSFFDNLQKLGYSAEEALANTETFKEAFSNPEILKYLSKKYELPTVERGGGYIGNKSAKDVPLFEYFADLSGIETYYGTDLTQDPFIRKELFGDDEKLIQAYKSVTGLRQDRLDAKDLAPYTVDILTNPLTKGL